DPRDLEKLYGMKYPVYQHPKKEIINLPLLFAPLKHNEDIELEKGSNIKPLPKLDALTDKFNAPVILKVGDDISTDEILSGGTKVLPLRSNIPEISKWAYHQLDDNFYKKALNAKEKSGGHIVVAGKNYAQGSSREHAALAPKYLGQVAVIAIGYARIGWQNLINYGILPFEFKTANDYNKVEEGDILHLENINEEALTSNKIIVLNQTKKTEIQVNHKLSKRQIQVVLAGGMINYFKRKNK
ncbi:MAG TPA: aconitate hydratase, partial [Bacteroidia bacterium]|nr:aconitate hydratase [Bacteroidia bacterium]